MSQIKFFILVVFWLAGCGPSAETRATSTAVYATLTAESWTATATLTPTLTSTPTATFTPIPSNTPTPTEIAFASTWDRYKAGTIQDILDAIEPEIVDIPDNTYYVNFGNDYASIVEVIYTGEFREIDATKKLMLIVVGSSHYGLDAEEMGELFKMEGRFIENGVEYWLPVQSQLIPFMEDELTVGETFEILIVYAGTMRFDGETVVVFLVNTF